MQQDRTFPDVVLRIEKLLCKQNYEQFDIYYYALWLYSPRWQHLEAQSIKSLMFNFLNFRNYENTVHQLQCHVN